MKQETQNQNMMNQFQQGFSHCQKHPHNQLVGICLNRDFLKNQDKPDWKVCQKCMSVNSKTYNDFLLFEDLQDKNEFQIEEYPFDAASRRIKNFLIEKQQSQSKKIFGKEIEMIDSLLEQLKEVKEQLITIQNGYEQVEQSTFKKIKQQYTEVYGLQHIKQALKHNDFKLQENKELDSLKLELHQLFNQLNQLKESQEIKHQISSFIQGNNKFITERFQQLFENTQQSINQLSLEKLKIEQTDLKLVELVRSRVPYPDALNTILYPRESFKGDSCTYKLIFQNNQSYEDKCHFFIGCIDSDLKDAFGYNHDMPCICFLCHLKQKEVDIASLNQLTILAHFDIKQSQVSFNFNDNLYPINLTYNFQPLKEWRLFISMCFPLKFKVYTS